MGRKIARRVGWVVAVLVTMRIAAACVWPTINDVTTGATPQYPDLRPQQFRAAPDRVFDAALATARDLGWEVTGENRAAGEIRAVATTRLFHFKDDVTLTIARQGEEVTVGIRSHSRVGKGDLGTNARRIRLFQGELAKRLGTS